MNSGVLALDSASKVLTPPLPASFWRSVHHLTMPDPWPPQIQAEADVFIEKCRWHGLLPLLFAEAVLPPVVEDARERAASAVSVVLEHGRLLEGAAVTMCKALADERFAFIKGVDFGRRLYPAGSLRPMQDIDILVPPDRMDAVCSRIQHAGFVHVPGKGAEQDPTYNERVFRKGRVYVDVHQTFVQTSRHRIDYRAIMERCVPMEIDGQRASRLEDIDALTYLTLSMSIDEFFVKAIRFVDLWLLLHQREGLAMAAADRAREWQTTHALYAAFSQACRLFPEFRSTEVGGAMGRVLPTPRQRFIDRWVLPEVAEIRQIRPPRRWMQLWRKACLMDSSARRIEFALSYTGAAIRQWGAR